MGKDRIPGKWFAGKPTKGADTPVNYIHLEDIINVVKSSIETWPEDLKRQTLNLVSDHHPTRKEIYGKMAERYSFDLPIWEDPSNIPSKVVESSFKDFGLKSPFDY